MKPHRFLGKAITLIEPWASAIAFAGKDIENRKWRTHYRGPIAIHAGRSCYPEGLDEKRRIVRGGLKRPLRDWIRQGHRRLRILGEQELLVPGHVLAIGMLIDCVERSSSPWFTGDFGFVLAGVIPIEPVPMTGGQKLWDCGFRYRVLQ